MLLACQRELLHLGLSTCRSVRLLRGSVSPGSGVLFLRLKVVISEFDVGKTIV
jgi:hypothetical protein